MSDEEEMLSEESVSEAFSASEDEWKPNKDTRDEESSADDDSDFEDFNKRRPIYNYPNVYRRPKSRSASKNAVNNKKQKLNKGNEDSDSDDSLLNYLVHPNDIDHKNTYYDTKRPPKFDCNAGIKNLSDSDSDDNKGPSNEERTWVKNTFNFCSLLQNAKFLEAREANAKLLAANAKEEIAQPCIVNVDDLLAMGEEVNEPGLSQSIKTKTSLKKPRPNSTLGDIASEDSEWEEVADKTDNEPKISNIQITLEAPVRKKRQYHEEELQIAFRRRLNKEMKDRQILLHKASLLCRLGHAYYYNRLLNDSSIKIAVLKLLPSTNAFPSEKGTEIKYFRSLMTWYRTAVKLTDNCLCAKQPLKKLKHSFLKEQLLQQIKNREARCKQDFVFIFICLLRGMGVFCRLVVNIQPLPLKPLAKDLLPITIKRDCEDHEEKLEAKITKIESKLNISKENMKPNEPKFNLLSTENFEEKRPNEPKFNVLSAENSEKKKIKQDSQNKYTENVNERQKKEDVKPKELKIEILKIKSTPEKYNEVIKKEKEEPKKLSKTINKSPKKVIHSTESNVGTRTRRQTQLMKDEQKENDITGNIPLTIEPKTKSNNIKSKRTKRTLAVDKNSNLTTNTRTLRQRQTKTFTIPQLDGVDDFVTPKKGGNIHNLSSRSKEEPLSDDDFEPPSNKKVKSAPKSLKSKPSRKVVSSDDEEKDNSFLSKKEKKQKGKNIKSKPSRKVVSSEYEKTEDNDTTSSPIKKKSTKSADVWIEAWSDVEQKWISINLFGGKVNSVESIRRSASSPLAYVFAFENDLTVKDVTARYAANWSTIIAKHRVDKNWLDLAIKKYGSSCTERDVKEDQELKRLHEEKGMPTSICEFKNHPLYVLERHLLKVQALYPPEAPPLGFMRGEAIYARECVHTLYNREHWVREARVVKLGEKPYKILLRPKWDKFNKKIIPKQPVEMFGYWQTEPYDPPTAENGKVPRNEYGNVDLYKPCMLPKNTVHLRLNGLHRVCKKLKIDCAMAFIGFEKIKGFSHPQFDGFIICKEFKDEVIAAWHEEQKIIEKKERDKMEARVYGNWKKIIRGLLIRERIKKKYNY